MEIEVNHAGVNTEQQKKETIHVAKLLQKNKNKIKFITLQCRCNMIKKTKQTNKQKTILSPWESWLQTSSGHFWSKMLIKKKQRLAKLLLRVLMLGAGMHD